MRSTSDGLKILIIALGIYALPEVADLAIQGKSIAADNTRKGGLMDGAMRGMRDTFSPGRG